MKRFHSRKKQPSEFVVYTFERPAAGEKTLSWRRQTSDTSLKSAIGEARFFYETGAYERVEVKQMCVLADGTQGDVTIRTFSDTPAPFASLYSLLITSGLGGATLLKTLPAILQRL